MTDINKRSPMRENRRKKKLTREKAFERIREIKSGIEMIKLLQQKEPDTYRNKRIDKFINVLEESIEEMREELLWVGKI